MPHTSLDQSIIKQLESVINSEITDIFQQISQLIAATYRDVNSDLAQIDFEQIGRASCRERV